MAITKTEIVNNALVRLGERALTDVDTDGTEVSEAILDVYTIALESLLAETLWTFATKRVLLVDSGNPIVYSKDNENLIISYDSPTDLIRIFETNDTGATWLLEEDQILSDTTGLGIRYTFRNEDESTYPTYFIEALSDKLASVLSFKILNSRTQGKDMLDLYLTVSLPSAKAINAQIGTPKIMNDNYYLNARFGGPNVQEFS